MEVRLLNGAISTMLRDVKAALTLSSKVGDSGAHFLRVWEYVTSDPSPTIMCGDNAGNNPLLRYALYNQQWAVPLMLS